ncbi:hypothetical protein [Streptomyces sp. NPDC093111]|uniref:hypothetical protein n=1 Tax=Streptomyces sp. NPDC093111 TaxID=3154978 RepID=UPI003413A2F9
MPTTDETRRFGALSALLTGFDEADLEATGLTGAYRTVAAERLGTELYARLLRGPDDRWEGERLEAARAVTYLWYTGSWPGSAPTVVSPRGYAEALVWKAAGLRAPAAAPGGYGSWADAGAGTGTGTGTGASTGSVSGSGSRSGAASDAGTGAPEGSVR